jgi:P4 family phage/plasmid primase-like protien
MADEPIDLLTEARARGKPQTPPPSPDPDKALPGTEDEVAIEFSCQNADTLRYVKLLNSWFRWDGTIWRRVEDLAVFHSVRKCARAASKIHQDKKLGRDAATAAIERAARNDPRHDRLPDVFDAHIDRLGGPQTIDLVTGTTYEPSRDDYITKSLATAPATIPTPLWDGFLATVTNGNRDLELYLQRMAGYFLTGHTRENALFFLYGTGANGKSVFINTLVETWGDYADIATITTFMDSHTDHHPTDLAKLRGRRLVVAHETEKGRHWAEARLKSITGGDKITARFMRGDFFTYTPHFKLVIVGNHKPSLRTVDEAIRRRIHLVPFIVTIPEADRDKDLFERLKPERPGILQWAIQGCLEWRERELDPPAVVRDATDKYLADEDNLARWIAECCVTGKGVQRSATDLWRSFKQWCDFNNEQPGSQKSFAGELEKHGLFKKHTEYGAVYLRIDLKPQPQDEYDRRQGQRDRET